MHVMLYNLLQLIATAVLHFLMFEFSSIKLWKCKDKQKLTIKTDVSVSSRRHCQGEVILQSLQQGVTIN